MNPHESARATPTKPAPLAESVRFVDWKGPIQMATDVDQIVRIVRAYVASWQAEDLRILPLEIGSSVPCSADDIAAWAVLAAHAELKAYPASPNGQLLREMALTMGAAASRLRYLTAMRSRERVQ